MSLKRHFYIVSFWYSIISLPSFSRNRANVPSLKYTSLWYPLWKYVTILANNWLLSSFLLSWLVSSSNSCPIFPFFCEKENYLLFILYRCPNYIFIWLEYRLIHNLHWYHKMYFDNFQNQYILILLLSFCVWFLLLFLC